MAKKTFEIGFRGMIVFFVFFIYFIFAFVVFHYYNGFYKKNIEEKFYLDNKYSAKVVKDLIEEDKMKMLTEARSIGASDYIYQAFFNDVYVTKNWEKTEDSIIMKANKMNKYNFTLLANYERNKIYGKGRGTEEKGLALYAPNGEFMGSSDYFDKLFVDNGDEKYFVDATTDNDMGGVEINTIQKKEGKYVIKVLIPVGKNSRFDYYDAPKGVVVIARIIDNPYLDRLSRIVNKKIIIVDEKKIVLSSYFDSINTLGEVDVKNMELKKGSEEDFNINIDLNKDKHSFTFFPIKDYDNKVIGYVGVGDDYGRIEKMNKATMRKFIKYQLIATVILMIILYFVLYILFRPMKQLLNRIKYIQDGNYKKRMEINCTGEIKKLADSINQLAFEVEKREESLKDLNLTLETKVEERTEELKKSLMDLENITLLSNNIHISGNSEKVIDDVLEIIYTTVKCNKAGYLTYDKEAEIFRGYKYKESEESPREFESTIFKAYNGTIFEKIALERNSIYYLKSDTVTIPGFKNNLYFFPLDYDKELFGVIIIETDDKIDEGSYVFNILKQSLAIYLNNDYLSKEQLKINKQNAIIRLLESIVHEIKTPLVGIKGFTSMIKNKMKKIDELDDVEKIKRETLKIDEYTGLILKEAERVDAMAMDLLDYASRNDYYEKYERVGLFDFVNKIVKEFENVSKQENVKLLLNIPSDIFVDAYTVQLSKVFTNLIKNSIEAKQGKDDDEISICAEREKGNIKITIKDKGTGIEKDKLFEIFEPLVTTKIQGTGLGLTIVKDIIEKHNGKISVDSEKNVFTEFTIVMPETII